MQFVCNGCVGDPCTLVVDDTFFMPKNCPFDNSIGTVDWKPEGAKNTEQQVPPGNYDDHDDHDWQNLMRHCR